jgi:tetraacyldisaccharide 4'-kinase
VSDGKQLLTDVRSSGDELFMLARSLPQVAVIASERRHEGATRAIQDFGANCIILDDGFQHRHIHRDLDIVLVDKSSMSRPQLMPVGILREPLSSLARADIVCYTHDVDTSVIGQWTDASCFEYASRFTRCLTLDLQTEISLPSLALLVSGIAQPQRFELLMKLKGVECVARRYFRDHHFYTAQDVESLISDCKKNHLHSIVTTEKDAVKLMSFAVVFARQDIDVFVACIETRLENDAEFWNAVMRTLHEVPIT